MKISDERFTKLSGGYETEQKELQEKAAILQSSRSTPGISYNCVGVIELPDNNETNNKTA